MFRTRMEAVSAAVMLRRIAVLGERGHDHIPFTQSLYFHAEDSLNHTS